MLTLNKFSGRLRRTIIIGGALTLAALTGGVAAAAPFSFNSGPDIN